MPVTVLGTCHHDCPDSCGWVATVEAGVAVGLRGNPAHPFSRGELCPKVNHLLERTYSPERVLRPLRRVGAKGAAHFEQISWDEALGIIAARLHEVVDRDGGEAVLPWWDAGNQSALALGGLSTRFFSRLGASRLTGALCGQTARAGVAATYGSGRTMDPLDLRYSRLVLLWGTNTRITNRHLWPFIDEARRAGARVVVIDPIRTATAERADAFVQPLPGTDAALALGMMHVLVRDGLVDRDYVERHAVGFAPLVEHVAAWTPERAGETCGLSADVVEDLARDYGTIRPSAIRVLIGAEHREHGAMLYRTLACLPVLVGAWRERGGGLARSTGSWFDVGIDEAALSGPDLSGGRARREVNMSHLGRVLTDPTTNPAVRALVVWNGNPLISVPAAGLVRRGLEREDLFTVVHEQFVTDTARYADVVLPATTQLEQVDVVPAWGHLYLGWNDAAIAPIGESVSNTEVFRRLAAAMGFTEPELFEDDESLLRAALAPLPADVVERLRRDGFARLPLPEDLRPYADGGYATRTGRAELWSDDLAAAGHDPLPTYRPPVEGPGGDRALLARFPLVMMTTKSHTRFLNSSYSHLPAHGPREGGPLLEIDPVDAALRGIVDGDRVRVWNDRGELVLPARVGGRVRAGVVSVPFGWWVRDHGGPDTPNTLTSDTPTDWGGGVSFHDTLVQVERAPG